MGCCNCNCINKLEHVEKVIAEYDPTEKFINYKLLTIWLNRKTGKAFILVSKKDGIAVWQPIDLEISAIEKIILNCGEVTANEKNEIIHTGECGARTVTDDCKDFCITLETDWGITGGGTVCAGEKTKIGIDKENTNLVTSSSNDVKDGDSIVYDGTNGKVIKKADQWRIGDSANSWTGKYNPDSKNLSIFPDDKSNSPILTMLPNGVIRTPWQPKIGAILPTTPYLTVANQDVTLGSTTAFKVELDQDGYDLAAGSFYPGDGAGQGAYYTTKYDNAFYIVAYKFLVSKRDASTSPDVNIKVRYNNLYYPVRHTINGPVLLETFTDFLIIRSIAGQRITIDIYSTDTSVRISDAFGSTGVRNNYLGIYMLG